MNATSRPPGRTVFKNILILVGLLLLALWWVAPHALAGDARPAVGEAHTLAHTPTISYYVQGLQAPEAGNGQRETVVMVASLDRPVSDFNKLATALNRQGYRTLAIESRGILFWAADVRDAAALDAAFARSRDERGPMHVLVSGVAGNFLAPAEGVSSNGFKTVIDIDLIGSFNASRGAFAQLQQTRGSLIYISAGIDMLMKNLVIEWGRYGVRANSVVPGPIEGTEGMKRLTDPAQKDKFLYAVPLRRMGTVDDIGQTAFFLASPLASFIIGCVVVCDGGHNLVGSTLFNIGAEKLLRAQGTA